MQAIGVRTHAYCEIDPFCQEVLLARMRGGWLDQAPVWPDLHTFPADGFQGVDILYGGIPCQPHSTAGRRRGSDDARDLWPATRRLVGEVRPRYLFMENVDGFRLRVGDAPAYAWRVTADLAALGYLGRWATVSAAEVGAPHRRERWFCLAYRDGGSADLQQVAQSDLGDAQSDGRREGDRSAWEQEPSAQSGVGLPRRAGGELADTRQLQRTAIDTCPASETDRSSIQSPRSSGAFPPGPGDRAAWAAVLAQHPELAPATQSPVRRGPDGAAAGLDGRRRKRLAALGNAVLPAQVVRAWRLLTEGA